ncbi:MAG TPA: sigma-70 family RNA polymerase sigma factor [Oscillospiraceae bacterium]|nr:sigma-70 family RNA polymerase sigma factor [Oscillospiraceae bacterium]
MSVDFRETVILARKGDTAAFSELYSLVYKDLYRVAYYVLRDSHDAQDVVSETVLDAYTSISKLRNEDAFRAWIMKILSAKIKRKLKEYVTRNLVVTYDYEHEELNYDGIDLKQEFNRLTDEERVVLSLSVVSGYNSKEIAKMLDMNDNTVRSKLARAKGKLKERLL